MKPPQEFGQNSAGPHPDCSPVGLSPAANTTGVSTPVVRSIANTLPVGCVAQGGQVDVPGDSHLDYSRYQTHRFLTKMTSERIWSMSLRVVWPAMS